MRCPECRNRVLQKSGRKTRLRIRGQVIFENGVCHAQCFWCKSDIEIPLEISDGTSIVQEQFVLATPQKEKAHSLGGNRELPVRWDLTEPE